MDKKISELLNTFIKMSGEKYDINALLDELNNIEKSIPEVQYELNELKSSMTEEKYFDASSEIIDRNIELSLKKKISHLQSELKKLKNKSSKELNENNNEYDSLNKNLESTQSFIDELKSLDKSELNGSINKLIEIENDRYDKLVDELNNEIAKKKEANSNGDISNNINEIEEKIRIEQERLDEVTKSLQDRSSYINLEAKEEDQKRLDRLNARLEELNARKSDITNSITYLCEELKSRIINHADKDEILERANIIAVKLGALPFLAIEDETLLKEELNQQKSKKNELMAVIENKKCNLKNSKPLDIRYNYLEKKIERKTAIKEEYEKLLNLLTHEEIDSAVENLLNLKEERKNVDNAFVSGRNSSNKKEIIDSLINNYEQDLQKILAKSKVIRADIEETNKEIEQAKDEINNLSNEKRDQFEIENKTEKEQDQKSLEETIKNIEYLNNRIKAKMTPLQILDQIEMILFENTDSRLRKNNDAIIKNLDSQKEFTFDKIEPLEEEKKDFTFEKVEDLPENEIEPEKMIISPDKFVKASEDEKDFSFSPLDNTGFVSIDEAYKNVN